MPRWEPNARRRLVVAAVDLFDDHGYDETTVSQIAERAGLTRTTFFRHFPDKREVLFAGQETHCQLLADAISAAPSSATALEAVAAGLEAIAVSFPQDTQAFARRLLRVVATQTELQERSALKNVGYATAMTEALTHRDTPAATAAVAAELGVLAFKLAFADWANGSGQGSLADHTVIALAKLRAATATLV